MPTDTFSRNLRGILEQRRLTQVQAAELLGISQSLVSAYLLGTRQPLRRTAEHIAQRLGVSADVLLHGTQVPTIRKSRQNALKHHASADTVPVSLHQLKRRWKQRPSARDQMLLALRVLFPEQIDQITAWFNRP